MQITTFKEKKFGCPLTRTVIYTIVTCNAKALDYYFKALKLFEKTGDKLGIGRCYSNIGEIYGFENKFPDALEFNKKAIFAILINENADVA